MFFKAWSQLFFGISNFFLIHHKLYPQDNHSLKFFVKKKIDFQFFFSTIFFTNFVVKFFWQIFFTKQLFWMVILRAMLMLNWNFFKNSEKKLYQALKYIVPVVCCSSLGLFSNKEVFFHIDFILIRMCPDVLFSWQKISNEFYWRLFFTNVFDKKIILNGHLEVYAYGESKFFLKFQKKFEIGP